MRNDLITLLGEKDNDNLSVRIGDVLVDIDGVSPGGRNIELVLDRDDLATALRTMAPHDTIMRAGDVVQEMSAHPDADVTIAIGATFVDIYAVQYDHERDRIMLRVLPEDLTDAVTRLARDGIAVSRDADRRRRTANSVARPQSTG